jgi:hypothetical protein
MSTPRRDPGHQTGARSVGDDDRKGGGWWKWLLALLLLLAAIILLVSLLKGGDDDKDKGKGKSTATSAAATPPTQPPPSTPSASSVAGGTLTAGGASLLPVPVEGLSKYAGMDGEGKSVEVQSVVKDEGFFVGTSDTDRVYVEYGGDVGKNESNFVPAEGDKVNLKGPLRPAPDDPAKTLKLTEAADAELVKQQGAYLNADSVEKAA